MVGALVISEPPIMGTQNGERVSQLKGFKNGHHDPIAILWLLDFDQSIIHLLKEARLQALHSSLFPL